uniref:Uncharacterized protein n=1 Tax=Anguilla anguilla TaxID=7936 RepID=A0A0E9XD69_ANGAN
MERYCAITAPGSTAPLEQPDLRPPPAHNKIMAA